MNITIISGNVCKTPKIHVTNGGVKKATFTLAVQRKFPNAQGIKEADFIPVVAWRNNAEACERFVVKGMKLGVVGYIQTRKYDTQDGQQKTITEVIADSIEFLTPKAQEEKETQGRIRPEELMEENDGDLPF